MFFGKIWIRQNRTDLECVRFLEKLPSTRNILQNNFRVVPNFHEFAVSSKDTLLIFYLTRYNEIYNFDPTYAFFLKFKIEVISPFCNIN